MMTTFHNAKLAGVSINLKTNEIRISAVVPLDQEALELAQTLEPFLLENARQVKIEISPRQMPLSEAMISVKKLS
jgi:hypothetical protein